MVSCPLKIDALGRSCGKRGAQLCAHMFPRGEDNLAHKKFNMKIFFLRTNLARELEEADPDGLCPSHQILLIAHVQMNRAEYRAAQFAYKDRPPLCLVD